MSKHEQRSKPEALKRREARLMWSFTFFLKKSLDWLHGLFMKKCRSSLRFNSSDNTGDSEQQVGHNECQSFRKKHPTYLTFMFEDFNPFSSTKQCLLSGPSHMFPRKQYYLFPYCQSNPTGSDTNWRDDEYQGLRLFEAKVYFL